MNKQLVLLQYKNGECILYKVISDSSIDIDTVAEWFEKNKNVDFERETLFFIEEPETINLTK